MQEKEPTLLINPENYSVIIENIGDGIILFDEKGDVLFVNSAVENFFNLKKEKILGKSITDFFNLGEIKYLFYLLGSEINEFKRKELKIREDFILEITVNQIILEKDKKGKIIVIHDISKERVLEKTKKEFVTIAAHQLRTPLSALRWLFEELKTKRIDFAKEQKMILEGAAVVERMILIVNDLLRVVEIEEGEGFYQFNFYNLEEIVRSQVFCFQELIKQKNIQFEFSVLNKIPLLRMDKEKISLAVQNLLENAIRYTSQGGMIIVTLQSDNKEVKFSIQDNGIGIPQADQEKIFQKFFRARNALKTETEGSGLGLYIAKNIIENHSGKIWFHSRENEGTIFFFTIPLKKN